ncbi:MAG: lipid A biosynthesis acyltransferase [Desulfobacterales bacterium]|nr:MAG: lipid A biosynthesis acyltransferase [Desulfobacterales bacterium]
MNWKKNILEKLEALGHGFFYLTLKLFGLRGGYILLGLVILVYTLCSFRIRRAIRPYLLLRFPGIGRWRRLCHTFLNLYSFGKVLVERAWLGRTGKNAHSSAIRGRFLENERLFQEIEKGKGLVLLTAHVGNWQYAFVNLQRLPTKVNVLMRYDENAVAKHYFDHQGNEKPFEIIDVQGGFGGMVDALAALHRGEVVTIMGDRFTKGSGRKIPFLGKMAQFPDSAYLLAASAGAPVAVVFAAQVGNNEYQLKIWDLFYPQFASRNNRDTMLEDCTRRFGRALETYLAFYPHQWYNFYDFWDQS